MTLYRTHGLQQFRNIVKFKIGTFPEFLEPQGKEYWLAVQEDFRSRYSLDEHEAHVSIVRELGFGERIVSLVRGVDFDNMCNSANNNDWAQKICSYADQRVCPHGVLPLIDRLKEGGIRYEIAPEDERLDLVDCVKQLERQIFDLCSIKPEDITDESIASYMVKYPEYRL